MFAAGVPVNQVNSLGWTALQEAILLNNGGAAGADPTIPDPQGRTGLENAHRLGFSEIANIVNAGLPRCVEAG